VTVTRWFVTRCGVETELSAPTQSSSPSPAATVDRLAAEESGAGDPQHRREDVSELRPPTTVSEHRRPGRRLDDLRATRDHARTVRYVVAEPPSEGARE
jgi:hypothetical protein